MTPLSLIPPSMWNTYSAFFHCSPATWQSRMPVQWFTSSPIFPQSAWGSLWKGGSSVHSSCLICCMLSLLLWQQKISTGLSKIWSCFMQVSDRLAALTESSLTNTLLRQWSRGRAAISHASFEPQPLCYHWMSDILHLAWPALTWKITVCFGVRAQNLNLDVHFESEMFGSGTGGI